MQQAQTSEVRPESNIGDLLRQINKLDLQRAETKARLDGIEDELDRLKAQAMEFYEQNGLKSMRADGRTFYIQRQIYVKALDREGAIEALKSLNLADYITYNSNKVSAYVRELAKEHELCNKDGMITASAEEIETILPEELKGKIGISEKFYFNITK